MEEDNSGGEYFLALHQWNAYKTWLMIHPKENERFLRFEVCSHLFKYCFVDFLMTNDSIVAKGALLPTLLEQRGTGDLHCMSYAQMVGSVEGE